MKNISFILTLSLLSIATVCVNADTLTGNGSFQTWSPSVLGTAANPTTGGPYWNNTSGDGPAYNIGWCLTGAGNCHISNPPGALSYYGNGTAAASNMSFTSSGTAQEATLLGIFTNQNGMAPNGTDYFGWYSVSNGVISMNQLFNSTEAVGTTSTFMPTSTYGFYFENVQTAGLAPPAQADYFWFMNDSLDNANSNGRIDPGVQHFTVFSGTNGSYYLGMEDTPLPNSDLDYNDMIVEVQAVPEPAGIALMTCGMGLVCLAIRRRRA